MEQTKKLILSVFAVIGKVAWIRDTDNPVRSFAVTLEQLPQGTSERDKIEADVTTDYDSLHAPVSIKNARKVGRG